MQKKILELVERHASQEGLIDTGLEGFQLFRVTQPVPRVPAVYSPSICVILQGSKRAYLGGEELIYNDEHYLCCSMPVPIEAEVPHATPEEPVLGFLLSLESRVLTELLVELEAISALGHEPRQIAQEPGMKVVAWDEPFTAAVLSLVSLLDDPIALKILGKGKIREVMFTLTRGEAGPLLRRNVGGSRDLFRVLNYIQEHLNEHITIQDLVKQAGMSKAVLHRKFKAVTTLSPLQFIKALRLNEAAMMIASGTNVGQAAYQVGYESSSQFNREFRRHFGNSPRQWANTNTSSRHVV
jgi:AraC-like DNA-binding protein